MGTDTEGDHRHSMVLVPVARVGWGWLIPGLTADVHTRRPPMPW